MNFPLPLEMADGSAEVPFFCQACILEREVSLEREASSPRIYQKIVLLWEIHAVFSDGSMKNQILRSIHSIERRNNLNRSPVRFECLLFHVQIQDVCPVGRNGQKTKMYGNRENFISWSIELS